MPNHITNRLIINADEKRIDEVVKFLTSQRNINYGKNEFSFDSIVPMPESLNIEDGGLDCIRIADYLKGKELSNGVFSKQKMTQENKEAIEWFNNLSEKDKEKNIDSFLKRAENILRYGYPTWYEWRLAKWGTKWDAYEVEMPNKGFIVFKTAWSGVPDLITILSKKFKDVEFEYAFADEDWSFNTGYGTIKNGESNMIYPEGQSKEAYEILFSLCPEVADKFFYDEESQNYKYKEEETEE